MADTPVPCVEQRALMAELEALVPVLRSVDPAKPSEAEKTLSATVPLTGLRAARIRALATVGMEQGWLLTKAAGPKVKFGRLAKDLGGYSVDAVWMEGAGRGPHAP